MPWSVVRRFEDFESLLWALKPQGPPWSQHRMPPTRWFNKHEPSFLQERQVLLQAMLESMLSQSLPPAPLRQFLEVLKTQGNRLRKLCHLGVAFLALIYVRFFFLLLKIASIYTAIPLLAQHCKVSKGVPE